jgi:hypothetical protein
LANPGQLPLLGTAPLGSGGAILDGPVDALLNGVPETWWQVNFDTGSAAGLQGWAVQSALSVANQTLVTKSAQTCVPPDLNQNLGGKEPTVDDLKAFCADDVGLTAQASVNQKLAPLGKFFCQCAAQETQFTSTTNYNSSCNAPCPDGSNVCLLAGSDPPDPTPQPVVAALFQPTSVCQVTGGAQVSVGGHAPKNQPTLQGALQIHGRPCPPDQGCRVGVSYQLKSDDIEFESGSIFASDPKFVDLSLSGATEPDAINLGPFLGFLLGEVPAGTALSTGHGRRSGSPDAFGADGHNTDGLALAVDWENKLCRISGDLVGAAVGENGEDLALQVSVALDGVIVNQPPRSDAGPDQTVECTAANGAAVTLDASRSTDADNNIAFYAWRRGSQDGALVAAPSSNPVIQTQQALGQQTYYVEVVDNRFAADYGSVTVRVADRTAPTISCNAPATITPSDVPEKTTQGISFSATAQDLCTGVSVVAIKSFTCTKPASCKVGIQGNTITIFDSGGIGDTIRWTVLARDTAGNEGQKTCELSVIKKQK